MRQYFFNTDPIEPICRVYVCRAGDFGMSLGKKVAMQHNFALQLLKRAYAETFALDLDRLNLHRLSSGKLVCSIGYFSISHSGDYVAVAVSDRPVGVDIQRFAGVKIHGVADKFFTDRERLKFANADNQTDCFYLIWCQKEALWKSLENQPDTIATVETCDAPFTLRRFVVEGEPYYLAVTGELADVTIE